MRSAQVGLGFGVGLSGTKQNLVDSWSGPRPNFPHQKRQTTTATLIPGETVEEHLLKKPLCDNQQEKEW